MNTLSRREFLRTSSLIGATTLAAACAGPTPTGAPTVEPTASPVAEPTAVPEPTAAEAPTQAPTAAPIARFKEAPMLAELVAKGELPPVEERLPENPCVCPVMESIGKYGGTMRRAFNGMADNPGISKITNEGLTWYNADLTLRTNMIESWEQNEDATAFTVRLRKGLKWSDSEPLTAAAARWYWGYVLSNKTLTPRPPDNWSTGTPNVLAEIDIPDDFTLVIKYKDPKPLFPWNMTRTIPFVPGHYLQQFHPDFVPMEDLAKAAQDRGFSTWDQYYVDMDTWYLNAERPVTNVWKADNSLSDEIFVMTRNAYFWQVDGEGQQLPYLDRITHRLFNTPDVFNMWVLNGEIDLHGRHVDLANYTLFKEGEEKGGYRVLEAISPTHPNFIPNMTCKNPKLRDFFQQRDARIAMSYAMNRQEVSDLVYDGWGEPRQYSPIKESPQYYPKQAYVYLDYDPDKANDMLDALGYTERDAEGFRLYKDGSGENISFTIEMHYPPGSQGEDSAQMVINYLADIGLKAQYKYVDRSLYEERYRANMLEASNWAWDRTVLPLVAPWAWTCEPNPGIARPWAGAWALYRLSETDPNAERPPDGHWVWTIWDLADRMYIEPDEAERDQLFFQILDVWAEELPAIGLLGQLPAPVIVKNGFHNYVGGYPTDDPLEGEGLLNPQTFFWE